MVVKEECIRIPRKSKGMDWDSVTWTSVIEYRMQLRLRRWWVN